MGAQIAQVLAVSGFNVSLMGIEDQALENARERIEQGRFGMLASIERGKLNRAKFEKASARIAYTRSIEEACTDADLVIEAVPEDLALKSEIFSQIDRLTKAEAILASNTAGLSITALSNATSRPERVVGWHWAQPTVVIKLAEIVITPKTDASVIQEIENTARRCGKNPVVINDQPANWGFVTNRIMSLVRYEADRIVAEGVATKDQVDTLLKDCFRWPFGPFESQDQDKYE